MRRSTPLLRWHNMAYGCGIWHCIYQSVERMRQEKEEQQKRKLARKGTSNAARYVERHSIVV